MVEWVLGFPASQSGLGGGNVQLNWQDTKLGGAPTWPPAVHSVPTPRCPLCDRFKVLLLQAYAPSLYNSERIIYIFVCNSVRCSSDEKAWTVLRIVRTSALEDNYDLHDGSVLTKSASTSTKTSGQHSFPQDSNSERDSDEELEHLEHLLQVRTLQTEKAKIQPSKQDPGTRFCSRSLKERFESRRKPKIPETASKRQLDSMEGPCWLQCIAIEVDFEQHESSETAADEAHVQNLLSKYQESEEAERDSEREVYEEEDDEPESESKIAEQAFHERISKSPTQVIRYNRGADPLWPVHPPPTAPPKCECGSERIFELQIMPAALYFLRVDDAVEEKQEEAGMNWACAAAYTCAKDCVGKESCGSEYCIRAENIRVATDSF